MAPIKNPKLEEEFFAREEAEKIHKLQTEIKRNEDMHTREARRKLHYMKCPKCGDDLKSMDRNLVEIDYCDSCGVTVLDKGELEKLTEMEKSSFKSIIDFFKN